MNAVLFSLVVVFFSFVQSFNNELFSAESKLCSMEDTECVDNIMKTYYNVSKIVCPGSTRTCAEGYTCCPSSAQDYACCPHENAVCCPDQIHCCPPGSSCDTGRCKKNGHSLMTTARVTCPGGEFQCPLKTTCCKVSGGQYGCCPFEEAVCCSDKLHCCPPGYDCGAGGVCVHA